MKLAPASMVHSFTWTEHMRPPGRSDRSSTQVLIPAQRSRQAAASPLIPAPTTSTSDMCHTRTIRSRRAVSRRYSSPVTGGSSMTAPR